MSELKMALPLQRDVWVRFDMLTVVLGQVKIENVDW